MSAAPLPAIEQWLSTLRPRVRALRVAQGANQLIAAALGTASVVLLLDAGFALPAWARGLTLSVWLTTVGVLTWRWVLVPWRGEVPLAAVAHEVSKQCPELGAGLRVAVGGAPTAPDRAALIEDTARQIHTIDRARAIPARTVAYLGAGALLALGAVAATAALVPGTGDRLRRVAAPWARPTGAPAFRAVVTSGAPVVRRGGPVTLSAYAERSSTNGSAPPEAVLVTRDRPDAPEVRTPMAGDGIAFHATRSCVRADFDYCVEIGPQRSEWFHVTALDAVELAPGTTIEIAPPEYARTVPKRTLAALTDFDALQFGTVTLKLKFTHPAAAAHLDWRPQGEPKFEPIPLEFAPDRLGATAQFQPRGSGLLRLALVREADGKHLRTDTPANVRVVTDEPPRFEQLSGATTRPRIARPGGTVPIAFVATDDLNVAGAELQYVLGPDDTRAVSVPIALTGAGTARASGRLNFDLSGTGRGGDTIRFRVVVTDNRNAGADGPQVAVFPRHGWSELHLAAPAPPLGEQEVVCVRDEFNEALGAATKALKESADEVAAIGAATAGSTALELHHAVQLNRTRDRLRAAAEALRAAASDAHLVPELRPVATAGRELADQQLRTEEALRRAETDSPAVRAEALAATGAYLRAADARLNELVVRNNRIARTRLDRLKLSALAAEQAAFAGARATDPNLRERQRALLAQLTALLAESDPLRTAYDAAKADEVRQFAAALAELATHLRELDAAAKQTTADARAVLVAAIAREQDAVAKRAAALFADLDTAARLAGAALPQPGDFHRVAELAAAGKTVDALAELEGHAIKLDRLAATFEKWAAERTDPKGAARQLALWQGDLAARFRAVEKAGGFAALPDEARAALRAEQKALAAATEALAFPPDDTVKALRTDAVRHTGLAREFLARDGAGAEDAMRAASRALTQLTESAPSVSDRLTSALAELEKLRLDFDKNSNAVDAILRGSDKLPTDAAACALFAKKFAPQAEKQRKLIAEVAALDLPGHGDRQVRLIAALRVAGADLESGAPLDVQASQAWVRREFDRFRLAFDRLAPPPELKTEQLHRKLVAAADALDAHGPNLTAKLAERVLPDVQFANQHLDRGPLPDASVLLNDARVAIQNAEAAFRENKPDETRRRVRAAADAFGRLVERLNGFESDLDRVKRLAALRRAAVEQLKGPKDVIISEEAARQLNRESEELTNTRVGLGGQALKKKALDLYTKLRAKSDTDRVGTDLKALTTTLDELAAKMADVADLAAGIPRPAPKPPGPEDAFLPSKPRAGALRDLAKHQRLIHAQVTNLAAELAGRLRPSATNPFVQLDRTQRAILSDAQALAKELGTDAANRAAASAAIAADRLRLALVRSAKEEAEHAANFFRQLATMGGEKPWGKRAAELVARQDAVRAELSTLLAQPDAAAAQQGARATELARTASACAAQLTRAAESLGPDDPTGKVLAATATAVKEAEKRLAEAVRRATDGPAAEAEKLRSGAIDSLRAAADTLGAIPLPPAGPVATPGEELRRAERAMREALADFASGDAESALKAARAAAHFVERAAGLSKP